MPRLHSMQTVSAASRIGERHEATRLLAWAGIVAPVLFTAIVILQGVLQPDYSHVAMPISALAAWPYGWVQNVNFYVFGTLMVLFAFGFDAGVARTRYGWIGFA